jgi:hypothetical protein
MSRKPRPVTPSEDHGWLAEFPTAERLLDAVKRARVAGFTSIEAYSPFPVEGLAEEIGFRDRAIAWLGFGGGVFGALLGYGMQAWGNLAFPIPIGGRPLVAFQAFSLIAYELMVLFAVLFAIGGMIVLNRLPRLHHPLFDVEHFHLGSSDKFFLLIAIDREAENHDEAHSFLERLKPLHIDRVEAQEPKP